MTERNHNDTGQPKTTLRLLLLALASTTLVACSQQDDSGEVRDVSSFHAIGIGGGFDVVVHQGSSQRVVVSSDMGELADLGEANTVVEADKLVLSKGSHWFSMFNVMNWFTQYKVEVTAPSLERVAVTGGSHVKFDDDFSAHALDLAASGGSNLLFNGKADSVDVVTSGGATVVLDGSATSMTARASGGSAVRGIKFEVQNAEVVTTGGSSLAVTVTGKLKARSSGGSSIRYGGHPTDTDVHASGGSHIGER
ncbi:MAG TPA: head GIN domain-containing protein [Candidatus Acidoferrum sp.]|nr:head GIN domain-containing protein [Candidatus Acidoferrum sp.]